MEQVIYIFGDRLFSFICHQQNDLLMQINGHALPLCFRCGFIYIGIFSALFITVIYRKILPSWSVGLFLISILFFEWLGSNLGIYSSSVFSRSISGFIGGVGGVLVLYHYEWRVNDKQMILSFIMLFSAQFLFSFQTAILLLILLTFVIFWTGAIRVITKIILSNKTKGITYEIEK